MMDYLEVMLGDNPQQTWIDLAIASSHIKGHDAVVFNRLTGETELHPVPKPSDS